MKRMYLLLMAIICAVSINAKTLVAYYSYTNNVEKIVNELKTQIECDGVEIEPAEKGLDYAANNYAIGSAQIAAIRNNPNDCVKLQHRHQRCRSRCETTCSRRKFPNKPLDPFFTDLQCQIND